MVRSRINRTVRVKIMTTRKATWTRPNLMRIRCKMMV